MTLIFKLNQTALNSQRVIITGGPGFGKTSVIEELEKRNYPCVHEVSRTIIKEQLEINGDILPWKNLNQFSALLMERRVQQFTDALHQGFVFFDRGIPDIIAYMNQNALEIPQNYKSLLAQHAYFSTVFIVPPWNEIFKNDAERKEDYSTAVDIHEFIISTYQRLGYKTIVLPKVSVKDRADFIINSLFESGN